MEENQGVNLLALARAQAPLVCAKLGHDWRSVHPVRREQGRIFSWCTTCGKKDWVVPPSERQPP